MLGFDSFGKSIILSYFFLACLYTIISLICNVISISYLYIIIFILPLQTEAIIAMARNTYT